MRKSNSTRSDVYMNIVLEKRARRGGGSPKIGADRTWCRAFLRLSRTVLGHGMGCTELVNTSKQPAGTPGCLLASPKLFPRRKISPKIFYGGGSAGAADVCADPGVGQKPSFIFGSLTPLENLCTLI